MSDEQRRELYAYPGDGGGPSGAKEGGRDQADIARLLRALNDDLRDDEPAQSRSGPPTEPTSLETPPRQPSPSRTIGGKPSRIAVGFAVVAAAAIGLGSIFFSGPSVPTGSDEPPNLIVPSGGASTSVGPPGASVARGGGASSFVSPASPPTVSQPTVSPPVIPPSAASAPAGMLTPGQTATIVRPQSDSSAAEGATVVVQPLSPDVGPQSPQPQSPQSQSPQSQSPLSPSSAASQNAPKPAPPRQAVAAPTPPKPAPTAPAVKTTAPVGGAGNWAVQVGTFSVSANADQLARRLSQNGRQAYVVDWQDRQGRTWKAVRVGNFANETTARGAAAQLRTEMNLSGQVIDLR